MKKKKEKAIICDIDGTLAFRGDRHQFDYSRVGEDTLNEPVANLLKMYFKAGVKLVFVSGRDDSCINQTRSWIMLNVDIPNFFELMMRKTGDFRKDSVVKKEIYENEIREKYNVIFVLDDRNQVVEMWRKELGLTVFQVAEGDF